MARIILVVEDSEDLNHIDIDMISDPTLPDDWEDFTLGQKVVAEFVESLKIREFELHRYLH